MAPTAGASYMAFGKGNSSGKGKGHRACERKTAPDSSTGYGLAPLRVRGIERVALHADLVMLARLASALARARAVPLAA